MWTRYHRHAAGQVYGLSRSLALYISINRCVHFIIRLTPLLYLLIFSTLLWCCGDLKKKSFSCYTRDAFSCSAYLKEYKNEDVAVGAWVLGLDTEHIDDRNLCCSPNPGLLLIRSFFIKLRELFWLLDAN